MRKVFIRLFRAASIGVVLALVLSNVLLRQTNAQQRTSPNVWKEDVPSKPATPGTTNPKPKTGRRNPPPVRRFTPLEVQWRLLKFTNEGLRAEASVDETFTSQDRLLLAVKANQNGYLYIIRQPAANRDGQLLFPSRDYNGGRNYISTDKEFLLPSNCENFAVPCWFTLPPPAGKEIITLIFSRDAIKELPSLVSTSAAAPSIGADILSQLLASSQQRLQRRSGVLRERFTTWVKNTNAENNEEIIETLTLNKAGSGNTATAAGAVPGK